MSESALLFNLLLDGLVTGLVYGLIALGFTLVWRICDVIHLAHGAVMLIGAYALAQSAAAGLPIPLALLVAAAVAILAGAAMEELIYRPLRQRGSGEMGMLTASLGLLIGVQYVLVMLFGPESFSLSADGLRNPLIADFPILLDPYALIAAVVGGATFYAVHYVLTGTGAGRSMRALSSNAQLATVVGLDTELARRIAMATGSVLTVPAAALMLYNTGLSPTDGLHLVLVAAVVAIIGGRGSLLGALLGGIFVGIAESIMVWYFPAGWRQMVTFAALYLLLLGRPQGLFGARA
jgi:branched-chain amino acid transport system permease protein